MVVNLPFLSFTIGKPLVSLRKSAPGGTTPEVLHTWFEFNACAIVAGDLLVQSPREGALHGPRLQSVRRTSQIQPGRCHQSLHAGKEKTLSGSL